MAFGSQQDADFTWNYYVRMARLSAPQDRFTAVARRAVGVPQAIISLPLAVLQVPISIIWGIVIPLTFGLLLLPFRVVWIALLWALIATSNLWVTAPRLRLPLLLIGVPLAVVAYVFAVLMPDPTSFGKREHVHLAGEWPLTSSLYAIAGG